MTRAALKGWVRPGIAILVLLVGVHIIYTAMVLAGYTSQTRDLGPPIVLAIWIYFALWVLSVWIAHRLWRRWLVALASVSVLYAAVGFLRLALVPGAVRSSPSASPPTGTR